MAMRLARILVFGIAGGILATAPRADTIVLRDGRRIEGTSCHRSGDEVVCTRAGGTFGVPAEAVTAIHPTGRTPERRPPRRKASRPEEATGEWPLPGPHAPTPVPPASDEAEITERLERLGAGPHPPDPDEEGRRRECAVLSTLIGNIRFSAGRLDDAASAYRRAIDHDSSLRAARLNLAAVLVRSGDLNQARSYIVPLLAEDPEDPLALVLGGEVSLLEGNPDEAVRLWERAERAGGVRGLETRLAQARRLSEAERGFERFGNARFDVQFDGTGAAPGIADAILSHLDTVFDDLAVRLGHAPSAPIGVVLYPRRVFHEATASDDSTGGLFDGIVRIPVGGLDQLTDRVRRVLAHELTHAFLTSRSRGNAPRWIQEGFAQVVEGRTAAGSRGPLAEANRVLGGATSASEFTYLKSLSQMEFFLETWSEAGLRELLDHLSRGTDIEASLRSVTGLDHEEFLRAWGSWLER